MSFRVFSSNGKSLNSIGNTKTGTLPMEGVASIPEWSWKMVFQEMPLLTVFS